MSSIRVYYLLSTKLIFAQFKSEELFIMADKSVTLSVIINLVTTNALWKFQKLLRDNWFISFDIATNKIDVP
jgi:hypothetical protein